MLAHRPAHRRRLSEADIDDESVPVTVRSRGENSDPDAGCVRCGLMFSTDGLRHLNSETGFRHSVFTECCASISGGCPACYYIAEAIYGNKDVEWAGDAPLTFRNRSSSNKPERTSPPEYIDVLEGYLASEPEKPVVTIYPYAKNGDLLSHLIRRRPLKRDVKSKKVLAAARHLYNECKESHPQCRYARDAVLPSRVLDVGTSERPSLRLFVNETEKRGKYIALSYCWGKPELKKRPTLLRRDTLTDMSRDDGIDEASLQKSVQDAVRVARMLGFKYLWVDALCIIQDCNRDKDKEIGKMAMIYKNAAVTVAAGTAAKAADGFLDTKMVYLPDEKVVFNVAGGGKGTVHLRSGPHIPKHTLDDRGWVLQEFLLSSRLLIFSEYELLWLCKERELQSVTGGENSLEYLQPLESFPWVNFSEEHGDSNFGMEEAEQKYIWKTVIEQYSLRRLGDWDDRLNALRGITRELETLWRDSSYFGLWGRWFVELMAWYKPKGKDAEEVETTRSDRAPSWSWASLNRRVLYKESLKRTDAEMKTVDMVGTRRPRHVVLTCRIWKEELDDEEEISEVDDAASACAEAIVECPDLNNIKDEVKDKDIEYLLLGTIQRGNRTLGVGLMVIKAGDGFHQRVGLAEFKDISIWERIPHTEVRLM
ncbi:heterokaryon incompatibility protein (SNF2 family domain-containing protein) [Colletotrichum truncatum]|uniref:Heterokaryon incompatibility protein (SNF2 family domain-containing protein) n=1 Tax=Colletotrichum truncatum TaxID=5467 RepID=A0ACC3YHS4_COLTU|nr:heterokaryon incompatibility protein (SNF2 family domain-containing protein) [Colletotrichum truncatum]KAF6786005.1 heterokaryon incompatibility protein (SNF2 family domain-containing protein) [Colletotrichum truncatum]